MKISGIYKIINKINGKYYVGSSDDICRREYHHKNDLSKNTHSNDKLQKSWNKYGENNFYFVIEEIIPKENLLLTEQSYLNICKENPDTNYNISYDAIAPMRGRKHSKKTCDTLRIKSTGRFHTIESRTRQSNKMKGRYDGENNPMYGRNRSGINNPMFGKKHSDGARQKIRENIPDKKGKKNPMYGRHHSKETINKIRQKNLDYRNRMLMKR